MFYVDRHGTHKAMYAGVLTAAIFCSTLISSASADPDGAGHKVTGNPDSGQEMRHGRAMTCTRFALTTPPSIFSKWPGRSS